MRATFLVSLFFAAPALAEVPVVVTDIPPVHSLVSQVMGDLGAPVLLMDQGANAHDYQMRPSQAAALNDADLLFWIGPEMTPWLDRVVDGGIAGTAVGLLAAKGTEVRQFAEGAKDDHGEEGHDDHAAEGHSDEDHADEGHADEGHDAHGHEGHSHDGADPHAWLDPGNASAWLSVIAENLSAADPSNAAAYAANAEAAKAKLAATEAEARATLAPAAGKKLVVFHDAYGYFFAHFDLDPPSTIAEGDAAEPGAATLAAIRETLNGVSCIFPEAQHDPKLIATLAEGTGARIGAPLDPEGRDIPPGPDLYGAVLLGLAKAIGTCVSEG